MGPACQAFPQPPALYGCALARAGACAGEWRRGARGLPRQCPKTGVAEAFGSGESGGAVGGIGESSAAHHELRGVCGRRHNQLTTEEEAARVDGGVAARVRGRRGASMCEWQRRVALTFLTAGLVPTRSLICVASSQSRKQHGCVACARGEPALGSLRPRRGQPRGR